MTYPWRDYASYLVERYGRPVYRIGIDGGFSCPNRDESRSGGCVYCDARGSSAVYQRKDERSFARSSPFMEDIDRIGVHVRPETIEARKASIDAQIEHGRKFIDSRYPGSDKSLYFQAFTNTYDDPAILGELYHHALDSGNYRELIVSTRPDCIPDEVLEVLRSCGERVDAVWVELGLQSGNDATLDWIGRGHTVGAFTDACSRLHEAGIEVCAHVILGLPPDGDGEILHTAEVLASSAPQALKIHNLHVVAGTRLYELYREGLVKVADMDEHLRQTILLLRHIPPEMVIQRFLSDTPAHRLAAPRDFGPKNVFLRRLREEMERLGAHQGDLSWA
jgi:radical SAM protein (TIGR01212 family)